LESRGGLRILKTSLLNSKDKEGTTTQLKGKSRYQKMAIINTTSLKLSSRRGKDSRRKKRGASKLRKEGDNTGYGGGVEDPEREKKGKKPYAVG